MAAGAVWNPALPMLTRSGVTVRLSKKKARERAAVDHIFETRGWRQVSQG
jgi:hypothetical protein